MKFISFNLSRPAVSVVLNDFGSCGQDSGLLSGEDIGAHPVQDFAVQAVIAGNGDGSCEEFGEPPVYF